MKFIIALFHLVLATPAFAQVELEHILESDATELLRQYPELEKKSPPPAIIDDAIRYLMKKGSYAKVEAHKEGNRYRLVGAMLHTISEIEVLGNENMDEFDIVNALGIKTGTKLDMGQIAAAGERVKELYARQGYFDAIVAFQFDEQAGNTLKVTVKVRERPPCLISDIVIQTDNKTLRDRLNRRIGKFKNKNFTEERIVEIEQNINEYLKDKRYINARLMQKDAHYNSKKTRVVLTYELTDPFSYEIAIRGNWQITTGEILRNLKIDEFPPGSLDATRDLAEQARQYYVSQGYAHVKINFHEELKTEEFLKTSFIKIEEGPRVVIDKMDIVGRISRPAKDYRKFILKNSSTVVRRGFFVRGDLENGIKNLSVDLNNEGYLRAKVQISRAEFTEDKKKANIVILLDEGPQTILTRIRFSGNRSFQEAELLEVFGLEPGQPLRLNKLEEAVRRIKDHYKGRGFIEMRIDNEKEGLVTYDERGLEAEISFRITEGPQVYIRAVYTEGNTFTKDRVILTEADLHPGDLVTPELLEETRIRLDKLGIFARVDIRMVEANTDVSKRTLIITVAERNPGVFRLGAGLTNKRELTARGYLGVSYNNLGGTGRALSFRGTVESNLVKSNYLEYEANFGYLEPFLFDRRLRGRMGYSRSEKVTEYDDSNEVSTVQATDRVTFAVEKDLNSNVTFGWTVWGLDSIEQFKDPGHTDRSRQQIAFVGPSLDFDYRDNPFLPTKGHYARLDTEYAAPALGSSDPIEFVRTQATLSHYLQLGTPKVVWANSLRGGYERNLNDRDGSGIPVSYAFFLGGYSTIRGYSGSRQDRIPSIDEFPVDDANQLVIPGESTYYLLKSEIRFPLGWGPLGGVVFYDAGEVGIQGFDFKEPFRQSYGIGFRVNTPVGPISIDYGVKINKLPDEDPSQLHVSIGTF